MNSAIGPMAPATRKKYRVAIRDALAQEMERDADVILMGQDIGLGQGLFRLTEGLFERFGPERVRDTPISETATVGAAIGLAMEGFRPVVEIAFSDLILTCFDTVVNQLAKLKAMIGPQGPDLPVVIRALTGAGIGAGAHHSQSLEALYAHMPGIDVLTPATPRDAAALLKAAIRGGRPTLFLEHKMLLRESGDVVDDETLRPGQAEIAKAGQDVTIVGYSATRRTALEAAALLLKDGIDAEVIDLRTISPLDVATVIGSVRKTGRLLVVQEAYLPHGVGSELVARVCGEAFASLRSAPVRLGPPFIPIPAIKALEASYLPSANGIACAVHRILDR